MSIPFVSGCERGTLALFLAFLVSTEYPANANTIHVPSDYLLNQAIALAVDGDTVAIAAGTYDKVPPPFSKKITILGLGTNLDPSILAGLEAGRCRIESITFQPPPGFEALDLLKAIDSLEVVNCVFNGTTARGIYLDDANAKTARIIHVQDCLFDGLSQGARFEFRDAPLSTALFQNCAFVDCFSGVWSGGTDTDCPMPDSQPPPVSEVDARVTIENCLFANIQSFAVTGRSLPTAVVLRGTNLQGHETGLDLFRAGAIVTGCNFIGSGETGTGIRAFSSNLVLKSCQVRYHEAGVLCRSAQDCFPTAADLGGSLETACTLSSNTLNLSVDAPVQAEYNFWGDTDCDHVKSGIEGQTVRIIVDESFHPIDCNVAVQPTTWSAIKTRFSSD